MKKISDAVNAIKKASDLPPVALGDIPYIEISGRNHLELEGVRSIIEYNKDLIRIRFHHATVKFSGSELTITYFSEKNIIIEGNLTSVEFE